jgi:hypothetical protein|tara:strand:+ start:192 stop:593 length:402 start_codon:yes stop_codon:yes gene_type:complete
MKINESRVKQIINEEMMMIDDKLHDDHTDEEGNMAKSQLYKMAKYAIMLHDALEDDTQLEAWVQSKITIASEYMSKVKHYLEYEMGLKMEDPELDMGTEMEPEEFTQDVEPTMTVDGEDVFIVDEEDANLMES